MIKQQTHREEKKDERARQIAAAAKEVFLRKGLFAATVEEIAHLSGVSKGTVYLYFKSKDELYISIILPMMEEIRKSFTELEMDLARRESKSPNDIVTGIYDVFAELYRRCPDELRVYQVTRLLGLFSAVDDQTREKLWEAARANVAICSRIIGESKEKPLSSQVEPSQMAHLLWAVFLGIVQLEGSQSTIFPEGLETLRLFCSLISHLA